MANNEVNITLAVSGAAAVVSAVNSAGASLEGLGGKAGSAGAGLDGLSGKVKDAGDSMGLLGGKARDAGAGLDALGGKLKDMPSSHPALSASTAKVNELGMSAKATAAALRGVPAQFTDIFTSIAGGQSPMTVFLQQGGQLKDMFGGAGPAAKALGGYVLGLINPFTVAAAAAGALGLAYYKGSAEADAYSRSLITTGNAAGVSTGQMADMARAISATVGTQGAAAESLAALAGSGRVAGGDLQRFAEIAVTMERTVGQSVEDTTKVFADLGKEPVKASLKLSETLGYLSTATLEQIKAADKLGDSERAASLAQNAYADAMASRTAQMKGNLGSIERGWLAVKSAAATAWDTMLGVGRQQTVNDQLAEAQKNLAAKLSSGPMNENTRASWEKGVKTLEAQIAALGGVASAADQAAKAQSAKTAADKAGNEAVEKLSATNDKYASKQSQLNKALDDYRKSVADLRASNPNSILLDPAKIAAAEAGIRASFKGSAAAVSDASKGLALYNDLIDTASGYTASYAEDQNKLAAAFKTGKLSYDQYAQAVQALVDKQPIMAQARKDAAAAEKKMGEAYKQTIEFMQEVTAAETAAAKTREQIMLSTDAYGASIRAANDMTALEQSLSGKSEQDRAIAIGQYQIELDLKKQIAAINNKDAVSSQEWRDEQTAKVTAAADEARRGLVAKANLTETQRLLGTLDNTAHEVFVNLFNDGDDAFKKLGQSLKAGLIDVLYQMTVKKWIFNIVGSVTGGASLSGTANAATGGASSLMGSAGSLSSLFSGSGLLGSLGTSLGTMGQVASLTAQSMLGVSGASQTLAGAMGAAQAGGQGFAASLGSMAPAIAGVGLALAGVYMLAKKLDHSGTPHTGGGAMYSSSGGLQTQGGANGWSGGGAYLTDFGGYKTGESGTNFAKEIVQGIVGLLDSTAETFGKQAGYTAAAAFADDSDKAAGAWGALVIKKLDETVVEWGKWANGPGGEVFSDGDAGSAEYLARVSADVRTALDGIGLPAWATAMLDELGNAPSLDQLAATAQAINTTQAALVQMGDKLTGFADLSDGAVAALIKAAGGIGTLAASASSYYDNFYSDGEKTANTLASITESLSAVNVQLPATADLSREWFRAEVEKAQGLGEAGATTVAALLSLSGAFASIVPATEAAADAAADTAAETVTLATALDALRNPLRSVEDIASSILRLEGEGASLGVDLLNAQGRTAAASAAQRALETKNLSAAEIALYDLNAARREEIKAANLTADLTRTRADLEIELLNAQGRTAEASAAQRSRDIEGFNAAQIAAYDYNATLRDTIAATRNAATALASYNTAASAIGRSQDVVNGTTPDPVTAAQNEVNRALLAFNDSLDTITTTVVNTDFFEAFDLGGVAADFRDDVEFWRESFGDAFASFFDDGVLTDGEIAQAVYQMATGASSILAGTPFAADIDAWTALAAKLTLAPNADGNVTSTRTFTQGGDDLTLEEIMAMGVPGEGMYTTAQMDALAALWQALETRANATPAEPAGASGTSETSGPLQTAAETERAGLQQQLDLLNGVTTAREIERNAIDESNRALYDQVKAQELIKEEADRVAASIKSLNATGASLQVDLLRAQGNDTGAAAAQKAIDTAGMSAAEIAIYDHNAAVREQITTAQAATAEANRVAASIKSLTATLAESDISLLDAQAEYATATGNTAGASKIMAEADRLRFEAATEGMGKEEVALYSLNAARQVEIDTLKAAAVEVTRVATERTGLQEQLDLLTGVTTARELERAAIDATNLALYDRVTLAQDEATYADGFLSAAEKASTTTASMTATMAALGVTLPDTNAGFRALVESQDLTTESGLATYTALMSIAGTFAGLHPLVDATAEATTDLAEAEKALAAERAGLMDQLWAATNQTAKIRAKEMAAIDPANQPIQQALYDIADAQTAFTVLQTAVNAEKDRLAAQLAADKAALDTSAIAAAYDAQKTALQAELDLKRQGYADQISAAQDAREAIAGIASALASAVKTVQIESEALDQARLNAARATIAGAARSGNIQAPGLEDALGVAGQDSKQFYSTFEDYARDQGRTAADISRLNDSAQAQLSGADATIAALKASDDVARLLAEAQMTAWDEQKAIDLQSAADQIAALDAQYALDIQALDDTLAQGQSQLDALLGIDTSVLSVASAVSGLSTAIGTAFTSIATVTSSVVDANGRSLAMLDAIAAGNVDYDDRDPAIVAAQNAGALLAAAAKDYPGFASGGSFAGGLRIVGENGPELEATGPSRIWTASQLNGALSPGNNNNAELVAEIRALRAAVAALQAAALSSAASSKATAKQLERWDVDGLPATTT